MTYIALTGSNMAAMARTASLLVRLLTAQGLPVAVRLPVNDWQVAVSLRMRLERGQYGELWRVGADDAHPELDALVQQQLQAFDIQTVRQHLASFRARLMSLRSFNSYRPSPIGDLQHG